MGGKSMVNKEIVRKKFIKRLIIGSIAFGILAFGNNLYVNGIWSVSGILWCVYGAVAYGGLFLPYFKIFDL